MAPATPPPTTPTDKPVLAIGDVHGDLPALKALLEQEGVYSHPREATVIQLGDLGHFGLTHTPQFPKGISSARRDFETYEWAEDHLDYIVWGNHDYAVEHRGHAFAGYVEPFVETYDIMKRLRRQGRMRLAMSAPSRENPHGGFLLTHAGLHAKFRHNNVDPTIKEHVPNFVAWVRRCEEEADPPLDFKAVRDAISGARGGSATAGGILWRDASEKLYGEFRQVFGHSQKDKVRRYQEKSGLSYCIDVHSPTNGRLAGIWLPEERVVEVCIL